MNIKRILSAALATVMAGTTLVSCSQPNLENLLPFNEEKAPKKQYSSAVEGSALTIYVDANAKDGGNGSEEAPFKTIPEAQAKIREIKAGEGLPVGGITVLVKGGEYRLSEPLTFTEEDSGMAESPITYVSESEFGAVLTGGLILSAEDFEPLSAEEKARLVDDTAKDKVVKVDLTKYGIDAADISLSMELFIDGERKTVSRYPNDYSIKTVATIDRTESGDVYGKIDYNGRENFYGRIFTVSDDVIDRISQWSSFENVYAQGYFRWSWRDSTNLIESFDFDRSEVTLTATPSYGISNGAPFYFFNVYSELDMPGEYFIDKNTGVLYVYRTDSFATSEIMISVLSEKLVDLSNVSDFTMKGLHIRATRAGCMDIKGENITIDNCKISNTRSYAITANGNNITIQNNELCSLGGYGINITGGNSESVEESGNLIYNNYIHDFSAVERTYTPAVDLYGCGTVVSHNEIADAPHMAIRWSGPNHIMEYNETYNVCYETSDCAAFYAGRNYTSYGCVIRYNYFHDIGSGTSLAHAIYWDDGLSGQSAYGNLIANTSCFGFLIGGGRDNTVENNLIINTYSHPISFDQRSRIEMLESRDLAMTDGLISTKNEYWVKEFPIYGQIIPWTTAYEGDKDNPLLSANPANCIIRNNISYTASDYTVGKSAGNLGFDIAIDVPKFSLFENNPVISNDHSDIPGFHNGDYIFIENAKALELCPDFEPIPFDQIGRID